MRPRTSGPRPRRADRRAANQASWYQTRAASGDHMAALAAAYDRLRAVLAALDPIAARRAAYQAGSQLERLAATTTQTKEGR